MTSESSQDVYISLEGKTTYLIIYIPLDGMTKFCRKWRLLQLRSPTEPRWRMINKLEYTKLFHIKKGVFLFTSTVKQLQIGLGREKCLLYKKK